MEAHLLDQYRNRISGCSFHSEVKVAPSGHWKKEEHVFRSIPHGVRFVEFRDGGNDTKFWAGSFGVKMVGAFVGVLHNGETFHLLCATFNLSIPSSLYDNKTS